jgi:glutamyl-tRNA reductase
MYRRDMEAFVKDGMLRVGTWQEQEPVRRAITDLQQPSNPKKKKRNKEKNKKEQQEEQERQEVLEDFRRITADIFLSVRSPELIRNLVSTAWLVGRDGVATETP